MAAVRHAENRFWRYLSDLLSDQREKFAKKKQSHAHTLVTCKK